MQHSTDITGKVFSELKNLFKILSESDGIEALLAKNEEITKLQNLIAYLKVHREYQFDINRDLELADVNSVETEYATLSSEENPREIRNSFDQENLNADKDQNEPEVENSVETFETVGTVLSETEECRTDLHPLHEISNEETASESAPEQLSTASTIRKDPQTEYIPFHQKEVALEESITDLHPTVETAKESASEQALEQLSSASTFGENDPQTEYIPFTQKEVALLEKKHEAERKFRLSQIKGVKKMDFQSGEEPTADGAAKHKQKEDHSLLKNNVSLDYMEAEKPAPAFKLDLNDRIAFTKKLFSGSQADLNLAVSKLNSFTTLEEAKEYLSEIYYERNWAKEDEYAQRLWSLVESKF